MKESENYLLGLKAVIWDQNRGCFRSPSMQSFVWDRLGWAQAKCKREGHVPPEAGCTCGIYATNTVKILNNYMTNLNAVAVLAAACGETEVWSGGFHSGAAQVVAVVGGWRASLPNGSQDFVNFSVGREEQVTMIAAEYFAVDVAPLPVALEMIKMSWQMDGYINRMDGGYGKAEKVRVQKAG
jgi:hypothetical protein